MLEKEKEALSSENEKLNDESRKSKHKLFELQAKVIDTEIEIAKIKKGQVGPIVRKK
ncbi:uncharacterized protein YlxW (UPF0749 family) [Clostridium saccharobutylicum]|nr:hypothetical protein [Clostridium saccharobutylicum]NOW54443.1 uncharacterized protein YlxW (UPF0749 family) [Clostridium saccharobutylicum]